MDAARAGRRCRAFSLAALEWAIGGTAISVWCAGRWVFAEAARSHEWALPTVVVAFVTARAFRVWSEVREERHLHTNVAVAGGTVPAAALVCLLSATPSPNPPLWPAAAFLALTVHAAFAGLRVGFSLEKPAPRRFTRGGRWLVRGAGLLLPAAVFATAAAALTLPVTPRSGILLVVGGCGLAFVWWPGGDATTLGVKPERALDIVLLDFGGWAWVVHDAGEPVLELEPLTFGSPLAVLTLIVAGFCP